MTKSQLNYDFEWSLNKQKKKKPFGLYQSAQTAQATYAIGFIVVVFNTISSFNSNFETFFRTFEDLDRA